MEAGLRGTTLAFAGYTQDKLFPLKVGVIAIGVLAAEWVISTIGAPGLLIAGATVAYPYVEFIRHIRRTWAKDGGFRELVTLTSATPASSSSG
jgi:hypothetical protein